MTEMLDTARELWRRGEDPQEWGERTTPDDNLIWKRGHPDQVKDLYSIGHLLDLPTKVVGRHRSKSVALPVGMFRADIWEEEEVFFLTRDNFHDLKLVVVSSCLLERLEYQDIHRHMTAEELFEEKMRSYNYSKPKDGREPPSGWDPTIYDDDRWFDKWCHDTLLRTDDGEIYRCGTTHPVYYEGINDLLPTDAFVRYEHGRQVFAVEVPGNVIRQMQIMQAVVSAAQRFVQARRGRERDLEELARYREDLSNGNGFLNDYHRNKYEGLEAKYGEG